MSKSLFVAFVMAMSLAACGAKEEAPKPAAEVAAPASAPAATDAAAPAPTDAAEAEKERVRKQNAAAEAALSGH